MKIKICGLRDENNIKEILDLNPDFVGFIFYQKSPRYVESVPKIEWPKAVKKVGVFVNEDLEKMIALANEYMLDVIQLHGDETPETCRAIKNTGREVIKAFSMHEDFNFLELNPYKAHVDYFLFDTPSAGRGGSGQTFNWDVLKMYDQQVPFFLSGGIGPMHAEVIKSDWVNQFRPFGIDLNSKFEQSAGFKRVDLIKDFLEKIR